MAKKTTATKKNPAKWKRIVARIKAGSKGGPKGKWSAIKANLATQAYKKAGGKYSGPKKKSNSLKRWNGERWDYVDKKDRKDKKKPASKKGRFLPKKVRESLTPAEKKRTNAAKKKANASGKPKAKYSKSVASKVRKVTSKKTGGTVRKKTTTRKKSKKK